MARYLVRRMAAGALTLFLALLAAFLALEALPGDPAQLMVGTEGDPAALEAARQLLGLDRPLAARFALWAGRALTGDLGASTHYGRPVAELVGTGFPVTLALAAIAAALTVGLGVPLGAFCAARRGRPADVAVSALVQLLGAVPSFLLGVLLIGGFALRAGWFPPGGFPGWGAGVPAALRSLALPAAALAAGRLAQVVRLVRAATIDALHQDYVRTARAKGLGGLPVLYRHALRNALIPAATVIGLQLGALLGGAIVVEEVFAIPGLGRLGLWAVAYRDVPLLLGVAALMTALVMAVNLAVDVAYAALDPRIRYAGGE